MTRVSTPTAEVRRRCVLWLSGQCRAGQECSCLPPPKPASTGTPLPRQRPVGDRV
jgi:hypothetical protein